MNTFIKSDEDQVILKVLVGSRAHGLHSDTSDFDYRGVFVVPTERILGLGGSTKNSQWIEGDIDNTSWELSHFLHLATKCNPTILETFLSPVEESTDLGVELRSLFPSIWNSRGVRDAFVGYGRNQQKKFLDGKDGRPNKFAVAYARSLFNAHELLTTGTFTINIGSSEFGKMLREWKAGNYKMGDVIDTCYELETKVNAAYDANPNKETDMAKVNEFLLKVRRSNFNT